MKISELSVLYHGTRSKESANEIIQSGFRGRLVQGKEFLAPVKGRVYFSRRLSYAIIYAIGGDIAGRDGDYSGSGFLFEVEVSHSTELLPDEDSIGKFYENHYSAFRAGELEGFTRMAMYNIDVLLTDNQRRKIIDGQYVYYAAGGKRALKKLPRETLDFLVSLPEVNVSIHEKSVPLPKVCWEIDLGLIPELKRDGSNFFDLAEVYWRGE